MILIFLRRVGELNAELGQNRDALAHNVDVLANKEREMQQLGDVNKILESTNNSLKNNIEELERKYVTIISSYSTKN